MLQRQNVYVAETKFIYCKDKMYMLQRQNLYVIKTNVYVIMTQFICYKDKSRFYKDKLYML